MNRGRGWLSGAGLHLLVAVAPVDPFATGRLAQAPRADPAPLERHETGRWRMVGTLRDARGTRALLLDPDDHGYLAAPGQRIGPDGDTVVRIEKDGMWLREGDPHRTRLRHLPLQAP